MTISIAVSWIKVDGWLVPMSEITEIPLSKISKIIETNDLQYVKIKVFQ